MNLQESIRRILREIEEDRIQIRLGRSAERHFGTVQNIIIQVDNEDITGQDGELGLGKMNIVIKDGEIIVGDIFIPEKYRRQGIATQVYQKISDHFGIPIVNSKTKGFNQTMEGGYMWKDREKFEPRNLQESIRKVLREETEDITKKILNFLKRRFIVKKIPVRDEKTSRIVKTLFFEKNGKTWAIEKGINERHQIAIIFDFLITFEVIDPFNIYKRDFDHNEQKIVDAIKIFIDEVLL